MNTLPFLPSSISLQRVVSLVLVSTLVALTIAATFASPVEAKTKCDPWRDSGQCCDSPYWPFLQDLQYRPCQNCWVGGCSAPWTEWRCPMFTVCP